VRDFSALGEGLFTVRDLAGRLPRVHLGLPRVQYT
jgi:hypothetical protein